MDVRALGELVAVYVDRLRGWSSERRTASARQVQAQGLLELAEQLQGILVPAQPAPGFRHRLGGDLVREARRRQAAPPPSALARHRKEILIGAAALGSVASLAGLIIALVVHFRHVRTTHAA